MRLLFAIILGMMFFSCRGLAQEDNITTATSALQSVLSVLKQSVEKLSLDNDQWEAKDKDIKAQVLQLQMQLGRLETQGDALNRAADKLRDQNPRRSQQTERLEGENSEIDDHVQQAQNGIKLVQQSLDEGYQEYQKLLLQLKGMSNAPIPLFQAGSTGSQAEARRQKEKLRLMKMIYDSQERQESLHGSILAFQQNTPLLPAAGALAHQQLLKEQIKDLEAQIAAYPSESLPANIGPTNQWDDTQLRQLELELKALEGNYSQLKDLMEQMSKKAQGSQVAVGQHIEGEKLQGSIEDLNRQGQGLMADLSDLRSQMVDLDKRKSRLEMMVKQL